jgi:hypothetical protein
MKKKKHTHTIAFSKLKVKICTTSALVCHFQDEDCNKY